MIIYAVRISDGEIASILNFVKYICAPNSKTEVHLSIRGPYKRKLSIHHVSKYNQIIKESLIEINGVGNFFNDKQNTVFLKCFSERIGKVWSKTSYGYNPHLTLYDGNDRHLAVRLYDTLSELPIQFTFIASELVLYDTSKSNPSLLLALGINGRVLNPIIGTDWQLLKPSEITLDKKIELAKKCFRYICESRPIKIST